MSQWAGPVGETGAIRKSERLKALDRAGNQCKFRDPLTARCCEARHGLQMNHVHARSLGGANTLDNFQALCASHNRLKAVRDLGAGKLAEFLPVLRS